MDAERMEHPWCRRCTWVESCKLAVPPLDKECQDFPLREAPALEGRKLDAGKPRWDLLPPQALEDVAKVLEFGARKYAPDNWRKVEGWRWRYLRAGIGHVYAHLRGERLDPESGLPHLAHAVCSLLFVLELDR